MSDGYWPQLTAHQAVGEVGIWTGPATEPVEFKDSEDF